MGIVPHLNDHIFSPVASSPRGSWLAAAPCSSITLPKEELAKKLRAESGRAVPAVPVSFFRVPASLTPFPLSPGRVTALVCSLQTLSAFPQRLPTRTVKLINLIINLYGAPDRHRGKARWVNPRPATWRAAVPLLCERWFCTVVCSVVQ